MSWLSPSKAELLEKRRKLGIKFKEESERAMIKRDIARIESARNVVAPTGWQRLSTKMKPLLDNIEKNSKTKGKTKPSMKVNWAYFR